MRSDELEKKTLNLRRGDWEFLTETYQPKGVNTSTLVRKVISNLVDRIRAKMTVDTDKELLP
jgi:hypothetical protein